MLNVLLAFLALMKCPSGAVVAQSAVSASGFGPSQLLVGTAFGEASSSSSGPERNLST